MIIDTQVTRLSNGIRVVTSNMPTVESVAIGVWLGAGGRYESKSQSGISHFIEHLLFKGTAKFSALDISRTIEGCGGYVNAFTQEEATCYYARAPYNHSWKVLRILCDIILHPKFDELDIVKERNIILEEIMMYRDHPEQVVHEMLSAIMWKNHQIGMPLVGSPESLNRIKRDDIIKFKNGKYVGSNTVFAFAGRVSHEDAVMKVEKFMLEYPVAALPRVTPVTDKIIQEKTALQDKDIGQTQLAMGFRTFGFMDRRKYILKMLSVILGENMSSRLFQVVREKYGIAYSVQSSVQLFKDTGCLIISAGLDREKKRKALKLIADEVLRLKQRPVRTRELARAREYVIGHLRLEAESPSGQMMWGGGNIMNYGKIVTAEEVIDAFSVITPDDVQSMAGKIFNAKSSSAALLSPNLENDDDEYLKSILFSF